SHRRDARDQRIWQARNTRKESSIGPVQVTMRDERKLILFFCAVAAVRVLIFSAAFPFFNNVDEQAHVDLVMKYARGQVPRELGHYSPESAIYISLYGTPDYFTTSEEVSANEFVPSSW